MSKTYAIADLHGRYDLLCDALASIEKHVGDMPHTIVTMGDYIDRGPKSAEIIQCLMNLQAGGKNIVCLKGNHEDIMLTCLRAPGLISRWWIPNGGGRTLLSYGAKEGISVFDAMASVPKEHIDWITNLPRLHIDKHRVFVHAGVQDGIPLDEQDDEKMAWMLYPEGAEDGHGERHVVHGHHQFEDGPKCYKGRTDLDTFAWYTGRLVVGVFDDDVAGGPVDFIEVVGEPATRAKWVA